MLDYNKTIQKVQRLLNSRISSEVSVINSNRGWVEIVAQTSIPKSSATMATAPIGNGWKQILILYGNRNGNQIYGGGTISMIVGMRSHPVFEPVYNISLTPYAVLYFFLSGTNLLYYISKPDNYNGDITMAVWAHK